ncbi:MAG: hypothetical protein FI676_01200 [SAR202 cluster bacterium]|nr:hypothetical protein [SAR202 cluster bacterium]MQG24092.1 hypothetical protein [SAR202 cluster bacterium]MQG43882.1 hypothetical protein [SAR202 cluster bacterium]
MWMRRFFFYLMKKNILKDLSSSIFYDKKYTLFSMIGDDVISFLDRMSTNDINQKKSSKTVITNNKGSIVDIISYKVIDQSKIIFVSVTNSKKSIDYMTKHVIIDDVEFKVLSEVKKLVVYTASNQEELEFSKDVSLFNFDKTFKGINRFEVFMTESETNSIDLSLYKELSFEEKNLADIELEYVNYDRSMTKVNPLELGYIDLISFAKGCYVGQEVIARLHNYQKVSKEIVKFRSNDEVEINSEIKVNSKFIGRVMSVQKFSNEFVGLCLIRKKYKDLIFNSEISF